MTGATFRRHATIVGLVGLIIGAWAIVTPQGGGPDEVGHLIRAGGVIRGQGGRAAGNETFFSIPDHYLAPDVSCWNFEPAVPASCATPWDTDGTTVELPTRADGYPVWSHLTAGTGSLLPGTSPLWGARLANSIVAAGLVGAALIAASRRRFAAASVIAAITPMAWFTFGIVNPSSMAIAGAIALWTGLVHRRDAAWLTALGWAALALPRRDGLIWACVALGIWLLIDQRRPSEWFRSLPWGPRIVVAASTIATLAWGVSTDSRVSQMVVAAPLVLVATEAAQRWWAAYGAATQARRTATYMISALIVIVATGEIVRRRPGGWDGSLAERIVGETGANLVEAIGRLGWLDTPLPWLVIVAWIVLMGVFAGASVFDRTELVVGAGALLAASVITAWVFELYQGNTSGTYWQGRYSLPLLAGVPIMLGAARLTPRTERTLANAVIASVLVLDNVALWAAARRFGVGVEGSLLPWNWDTYDAPLPVIVVLVIHAAATVALGMAVISEPEPDERAQFDHV